MAKKRNLLLLLALLALFVVALPLTVHAADTPGAWKTISGKRYFVDGNGKKVKGWITWMNGRYYTSPKTGVMLTGKQTIDKKLYYFNPSGNYVGKAYTGWRNIKSKRFYFSPEDLAAARGWETIGGKKYYFDADFSMHKGWRSYQKKW